MQALIAKKAELLRRLEDAEVERQEALMQRDQAEKERVAASEELKKLKKRAAKLIRDYRVGLLARHIGRYDMEAEDVAHLVLTARRKVEKKTGKPSRKAIRKSRFFKPALDEIHARRDAQINLHLRNRFYKETRSPP
jgi:hypothetical protein